MTLTGKTDEVALACQNGLFYILIREESFEPRSVEAIFRDVVVLQIKAAGNGSFLVITTTVG
jgi:hypothetical protein